MTGWTAVLAGCAAVYATKLAGYLAPHSLLERPRTTRVATLTTVALLAALAAVQAVVTGRSLGLDARVPALAVAALLLWRRASFVVVLAGAALVAALLRAAGWAL